MNNPNKRRHRILSINLNDIPYLSILAILLTLYFGIYDIPGWVDNITDQRSKKANSEIIKSLKELVYSDSTVNDYEVINLIKAKQIEHRIQLEFSIKEFLLLAQDSFVEDKFLDLATRRSLIEEIEILKNNIPESEIIFREAESSYLGSVRTISITTSIIFSIVAIFYTIKRVRSDIIKNEELENFSINELSERRTKVRSFGFAFSNSVSQTIQKYPGIEIIEEPRKTNIEDKNSPDIVFSYNGQKYLVVVKYLTKSKVGLRSIKMLEEYDGESNNLWLIYNTGLTPMALNEIKRFNNSSPVLIRALYVPTISEFDEILNSILS